MTAATEFTRLVLAEGATIEEVVAAADRAGWELRRRVERAERAALELVWFTPGVDASIHYIEDFLVDVAHLLVRGVERRAGAELARQVMPTVDVTALVADAWSARGREARVRAIRRLAVAQGPERDGAALEVFLAYLQDPDPRVREATVFATAYPAWSDFAGTLARLAREDPEPAVRDMAQRMRESLARHGWESGSHGHTLERQDVMP